MYENQPWTRPHAQQDQSWNATHLHCICKTKRDDKKSNGPTDRQGFYFPSQSSQMVHQSFFSWVQYTVLGCLKEWVTFINSDGPWWSRCFPLPFRCWLAFFTSSQKSECKIPTKPLGPMCLPRSHTEVAIVLRSLEKSVLPKLGILSFSHLGVDFRRLSDTHWCISLSACEAPFVFDSLHFLMAFQYWSYRD